MRAAIRRPTGPAPEFPASHNQISLPLTLLVDSHSWPASWFLITSTSEILPSRNMPSPAQISPPFHANFKRWAPPYPKLLSSHRSLPSHSSVSRCSPPSKPCHDSPRSTLPAPKHHLPARPPAEVCVPSSTNTEQCTPSASQTRAREISIPPPRMPSSESPEHGPSFPHDPAHLTPSSPQIAVCNTQDPAAPPDEPPPLEGGVTGPSPSSPDATTTSSNGSLEEFLTLPVLQNDNDIPIDPAILADDRP